VPQAQAVQQQLTHAPAPFASPSYGQVSNSSKVHRREGHLASVRMKLAIFTLFFCSSAEYYRLHLTTVFLLLRQRRVAAGNGLGTSLGTTIKNVRTC
jgi:hypothetical protein